MPNAQRLLNTSLEIKRRLELISGDKLTDQQIEERELCENSFLLFVEKAWPIIEGNAPFVYGWHAQAICEHLEALYKLEINRLIINLPPRCGKSNLCSVLYCAWVWTREPHLRFLYTAYAQSLSVRDSVKCRRLVQSNWYQSLWGNKFRLLGDVNNKLRFDNDKSGYRIASSVGGSNTGEGGHFEIVDDPNNVVSYDSEIVRLNTNNWHDYVMPTRYSGLIKEFRRMVVQQRVGELDVTGNVLAKEDSRWIHLCLPLEFETDNKCKTIALRSTKGKIWEDPRKKEGQLLWPEGLSEKDVILLKTKDFKNDSQRIASQLQQRPFPAGGGILKVDWFKPWRERDMPQLEYIMQSWDTALTSGRNSAHSACTTWGVFKDKGGIYNLILLSLYKARLEYPDLHSMAIRLANNYYDTYFDEPLAGRNPPDLILIEGKVSGYCLLANLMRANLPVMKFDPGKYGDKDARCRMVSHIIENGLVWLPTESPNFQFFTKDSQTFLKAAASFPDGDGIDVIDSMSQAFIRLINTGWIVHKEDPLPEQQYSWEQRPYT